MLPLFRMKNSMEAMTTSTLAARSERKCLLHLRTTFDQTLIKRTGVILNCSKLSVNMNDVKRAKNKSTGR